MVARGCLSLLTALILVLANSQVAYADYNVLGTGQFPTSSLSYYFYGPDSTHLSPTQTAADDWSALSDLTVSSTAQGYEKISVFTGNWGATTWDGRAIVCGVSGTCYSFGPINETYNWAEIDFNTYWTSAFSWGQKRALANHEFGHTFSLAHVSFCNPDDHIMYSPVHNSCNGGIMTPDSHAITGINFRY